MAWSFFRVHVCQVSGSRLGLFLPVALLYKTLLLVNSLISRLWLFFVITEFAVFTFCVVIMIESCYCVLMAEHFAGRNLDYF